MSKFIIHSDPYTTGFQEHVTLNLKTPIIEQLRRRRLQFRSTGFQGNASALKEIIQRNSSLRVDFGWSFESGHSFQTMMDECLEVIPPKYNEGMNSLVTDLRCSWLGFVPFNTFEKSVYEDLSPSSLILFNNELIDFQTDVINFISEHRIFRQHSILRNEWYRFDVFREVRKDKIKLEEAYQYYMQALKDILSIQSIPRDFLEDQIGCHFLHNPELFFELLGFSILKGEVHE